MHYYTFNIADYRKDTAHLSRLEHSIYRDLIDWYYLDESPITSETQTVMRRLRLATEEDEVALKNVLNDFFELKKGCYSHKRIEEDIKSYVEKCETNKKNGKRGGRPKASKYAAENPAGFQVEPSANRNESELNPNHKPITSVISEEPDGSLTKELIPSLENKKNTRSSRKSRESNPLNVETWAAYESAYILRYRVKPVRNAKVNGQIANLVTRLGQEAPAVAEFYVSHGKSYYVQKAHSVDLLLADAEGLRTQWASGRKITNTSAMQQDKTQSNFEVMQTLLRSVEK